MISNGRWMMDEGAARGYRAHEDDLVEHRNLSRLCFLGGSRRRRLWRQFCRGGRVGSRFGCGFRLRKRIGKSGLFGLYRTMPEPSRILSLLSHHFCMVPSGMCHHSAASW